jgi:hypothetical protein
MDSIGLSVGVVATHAPDGMLAFTGKRRVIDPPFSGLVTGLPKAPPEIARTCHPFCFRTERDDTDGPA